MDALILPLDPSPDSPLFRASLSNLDYRTASIKRLCKSAISKAEALQDLLVMVEAAEADLLGSLLSLAQTSEGSESAVGGITEFKDWRARERKDERDRLDQLVTAQLKNLRWDIKSRGAGGGGSLAKFEETSKHHYSSLARYLVPQPALTPAQLGMLDARKAIEEAEYDVKRYTVHSHFLWSAPPFSPSTLEASICLYSWLNGLLPEDLMSNQGTPKFQGSPREGERPVFKSSQSDAQSPLLTSRSDNAQTGSPSDRQRGLNHKGSLPTVIPSRMSDTSPTLPPSPSLPVSIRLKHHVRTHLTRLARRKDALEVAWAEREIILRGLEQVVEDKLDAARTAELAGDTASVVMQHLPRPSIDSRPSMDGRNRGESVSAPGGPIGFIKDKKQKGVGSRIKGMISSASLHANLSSRAGPSQIPSSAPTALTSQRMSLQLPSTSAKERADAAASGRPITRHSIQAVPARQEGYTSPFLPLITSRPDTPSSLTVFEGEALSPPTHFGVPMEVTPTPPAHPMFRDLQGDSGEGLMEEEMQREMAGRKKEGLLWTTGNWEDVSGGGGRIGERREKGKWEKCWVVLAASRIQEHRDGLQGKPEAPSQTIDLKIGATAREGRDTDRRWTFEVVTPTNGKRVYQATSAAEMKSWIYAISNAVESSLNGTSTVRTFDISKLQGEGSYDEHGSPVRQGRLGGAVGLGLPMPTHVEGRIGRGMSTPASATTAAAGERGISPPAIPARNWARPIGRRTSIKQVIRETRNSFGYGNPPKLMADPAGGEGHEHHFTRTKRSSLIAGSRHSSNSSSDGAALGRTSPYSVGEGSVDHIRPPSRGPSRGPSPVAYGERAPSWYSHNYEEELAAIGQAHPLRPAAPVDDATITRTGRISPVSTAPSESLLVPEAADMALLRKIADLPSNQSCADCYRSLNNENSQRWATISIQQKPVCAFLCIRCAGVHRSLGTHISKVRSPDLDRWSVEAILCARSWGNARTNSVFERMKPEGMRPPDESLRTLKEWIEGKYVHGVWLNDVDRTYYLGIQEGGIAL